MAEIEWEYHDFKDVNSEKKEVIQGNQFNNQLVYMASALARQLRFSEKEEKLFAMAVSQLDFFSNNGSLCVDLRVADMQEKLGTSSGSDYSDFRDQLSRLMDKSKVRVSLGNEDNDTLDGRLIRSVRTVNKRGAIRVRFDDEFIPALQYCKVAYTRIPLDDTLAYKSRYAIILQRYLTTMYRTSENDPLIQNFNFTTKQLKDMFGLDKDDYCYKSGVSKGKFQRTRFEQQTLQLACDEINEKSQVMRAEWKKDKSRGIIYYRISCIIATKVKKNPPVVETEVAENQMSIDDFDF